MKRPFFTAVSPEKRNIFGGSCTIDSRLLVHTSIPPSISALQHAHHGTGCWRQGRQRRPYLRRTSRRDAAEMPNKLRRRDRSLFYLASRLLVSLAAMGYTVPALLGEMPPVTIKPTPPMARSAKNAASLESPPPAGWQRQDDKGKIPVEYWIARKHTLATYGRTALGTVLGTVLEES